MLYARMVGQAANQVMENAMQHGKWLAGALFGLVVSTGVAWACADGGCSVSWKLTGQEMDCASRATLAPGNDTRVNMLLLLRDRAGLDFAGLKQTAQVYEWTNGAETFYSWRQLNMALFPGRYSYSGGFAGEAAGRTGSHCVSLDSGAAAFAAAMAANRGLPAGERDALTAARQRLVQACDGAEGDARAAWPAVSSGPGKSFLAYLQAGEAFYRDDWDAARSGFAALRGDSDPWLKETANYMLPRVLLNAAQAKSVDEYGWFQGPKAVDQNAAQGAGQGFGAYLKTWPQGRYAASAHGLQRRVAWLTGDRQGLARTYAGMLGKVDPGTEAATMLVEEIDNKLIADPHQSAAADGALLLAAHDLMRMRPSYGANGEGPPSLTAAELEAQAPQFAGEQVLFDYLRATHAFYVAKDYKRVLALVADAARQPKHSNLDLSRQVLRGMALAALKDRNEAGFWQELIGGTTSAWQRTTVELGLALNWERAGKLDAVFAPGSPVRDSAVRRILLTWSAPPPLLRKVVQDRFNPAEERDAALNTLLANQLIRGEFAGFVKDLRLPLADSQSAARMFIKGKVADGGYPCAPIAVTAAALAKAPQDIAGRLCLGDFFRIHGLDYMAGKYDQAPKPDELGGAARGFPAPRLNRSAFYSSIIASPSAGANDKAYALYRAVMCYSPSKMNDCGGVDVAEAQRKAWFQQLKRDYPASAWAKRLRYYW